MNGTTVVVGAGPYGLSASAHLLHASVPVRTFGVPMESWARHMPAGMRLRSHFWASNIGDPEHALGLGRFHVEHALDRVEPIPIERFVDYGRWFQEEAVPDLDRRRVVHLSQSGRGFELRLEDGETVTADRVVVAAGIVPFAWIPSELADFAPELVSHAADEPDLSRHAGRRVAVVGGGQSAVESAALLAEAGAEVELLVRAPDIRWLAPDEFRPMPLALYAYERIGIGGRRTSWIAAWPGLFRRLPRGYREPLAYGCIRPAGAAWLRARSERVKFTFGAEVDAVTASNGGARVGLRDGRVVEVDHVLAATGYRVDITRYDFIAPELLARIRTRSGYPVLTGGLESTVSHLHFVGASAADSFGPVMRFVSGTWAAARAVTRAVAGRRAARVGFSW